MTRHERGAVLLGACLLLAGCATPRTELTEGSSGLSGAIPGGDGRALAAYRTEFRANALAGMDTLMLRINEVWQRDNQIELARLYAEEATLLTPDGHLIVGGEPVRAYVASRLPRVSSVDTWRDEFAASGLMTFMYGRYELDGVAPGADSRGVHITVAMRDRFNWQIRSKMYVAFEGVGELTDPGLVTPEPPHVNPDSLRARYGRRALRGADPRAEWRVDSYFYVNQYLSSFRHAWNSDDFEGLVAMMAPGVVFRLPFDVPAKGKTDAAYSLQRLLPAVSDLSMSILDFDTSERLSFALGHYDLSAGGQRIEGYYTAVLRHEDAGTVLTALVFSGAGANVVPREGGLP